MLTLVNCLSQIELFKITEGILLPRPMINLIMLYLIKHVLDWVRLCVRFGFPFGSLAIRDSWPGALPTSLPLLSSSTVDIYIIISNIPIKLFIGSSSYFN